MSERIVWNCADCGGRQIESGEEHWADVHRSSNKSYKKAVKDGTLTATLRRGTPPHTARSNSSQGNKNTAQTDRTAQLQATNRTAQPPATNITAQTNRTAQLQATNRTARLQATNITAQTNRTARLQATNITAQTNRTARLQATNITAQPLPSQTTSQPSVYFPSTNDPQAEHSAYAAASTPAGNKKSTQRKG